MKPPFEIVAHDAEHEIYRLTLAKPQGFRSKVTVSRRLKTVKTMVALSANLRVTDLMSDELLVFKTSSSDGARYTLAACNAGVAYPLLEGSKLEPAALFEMAEHFHAPSDATPKPIPTPAAPAAPKAPRAKRASAVKADTAESADEQEQDGPVLPARPPQQPSDDLSDFLAT